MTQRYVIHLPVVAADLPAAQRLARVIGRWMSVLPMTDPGGDHRLRGGSAVPAPPGLLRRAAARWAALRAPRRSRRRVLPPPAPLTQPDELS